jgi:hypothetical protein
MRHRLPTDRQGTVTKLRCADVTLYVTLNRDAEGVPRELFIKADQGWQGWCDVLAETASMYLQLDGSSLEVLCRHWRHHRFEPRGIGQGSSIPDVIAKMLEKAI